MYLYLQVPEPELLVAPPLRSCPHQHLKRRTLKEDAANQVMMNPGAGRREGGPNVTVVSQPQARRAGWRVGRAARSS